MINPRALESNRYRYIETGSDPLVFKDAFRDTFRAATFLSLVGLKENHGKLGQHLYGFSPNGVGTYSLSNYFVSVSGIIIPNDIETNLGVSGVVLKYFPQRVFVQGLSPFNEEDLRGLLLNDNEGLIIGGYRENKLKISLHNAAYYGEDDKYHLTLPTFVAEQES